MLLFADEVGGLDRRGGAAGDGLCGPGRTAGRERVAGRGSRGRCRRPGRRLRERRRVRPRCRPGEGRPGPRRRRTVEDRRVEARRPVQASERLSERFLRRRGLLQRSLHRALRELRAHRPRRHLLAGRHRRARSARSLRRPRSRQLRLGRDLRRRRRLRSLPGGDGLRGEQLHRHPLVVRADLRRARDLWRRDGGVVRPLRLRLGRRALQRRVRDVGRLRAGRHLQQGRLRDLPAGDLRDGRRMRERTLRPRRLLRLGLRGPLRVVRAPRDRRDLRAGSERRSVDLRVTFRRAHRRSRRRRRPAVRRPPG